MRDNKNTKMEEVEIESMVDAFEENFNDEPKVKRSRSKKAEPQTIVKAMEEVLNQLYKKDFSAPAKKKAKPHIDYLVQRLGLTEMQCLFLAMLCDSGGPLDYARFAGFLGCRRLKLISHDDELQQLVRSGYINRIPCDHGEDDYAVRTEALVAFQKNESYSRPSFENLSREEFFDRLRYLMEKKSHNTCTLENLLLDIQELFNANPRLTVVNEMNKLGLSDDNIMIMLCAIYKYVEFNDTIDERNLQDYLDPRTVRRHLMALKRNVHELNSRDLIVQTCDDGFLGGKEYELSDSAKEKFLDGFVLEKKVAVDPRNGLLHYEDIKEKNLFYNNKEKEQIDRLADMLKEENLSGIQERLEQRGMRKGFACLFYGAPGTGKTETVLQIARLTGRDIMQVSIAGLRDKFVGESEKNIKAIFSRYRKYCEKCDRAPLLLFNEADAIINKRTSNIQQSVDKMDNAIQNIILEEIENFEGILIATTNLKQNMDEAYARRFIYKIEFEKPSEEAKANIWKALIPELGEKDAETLAKEYDLSGGEIENISRKQTVDSILYGTEITLKQLRDFCDSEVSDSKKKGKKNAERSKIIGFSKSA